MMIHIPHKKSLAGFLIVLCGLSSCHKDSVVPTSLIPFTCQIGLADFINGTTRTTYTYQYDAFGNRTMSNDGTTMRIYTYDADQYLINQKVNGTTYAYTYAGSPKLISRIAGGTYTYDYTYDGATLKTFVEKNGSDVNTYEFTAGQLSKITLSTGDVVVVSGGKITQRTTTAGIITNYKYDGDGQATQIESITSATGERTVSQYTYDNKLSSENASLRVRGFPVLPKNRQPGFEEAIGGPILLHNYQTITTTAYRKNTAGTEETVATNTLTYRYQYKGDYSLGYARSDGARAKFYYTNCE